MVAVFCRLSCDLDIAGVLTASMRMKAQFSGWAGRQGVPDVQCTKERT